MISKNYIEEKLYGLHPNKLFIRNYSDGSGAIAGLGNEGKIRRTK
jgi:hypothetical protein